MKSFIASFVILPLVLAAYEARAEKLGGQPSPPTALDGISEEAFAEAMGLVEEKEKPKPPPPPPVAKPLPQFIAPPIPVVQAPAPLPTPAPVPDAAPEPAPVVAAAPIPMLETQAEEAKEAKEAEAAKLAAAEEEKAKAGLAAAPTVVETIIPPDPKPAPAPAAEPARPVLAQSSAPSSFPYTAGERKVPPSTPMIALPGVADVAVILSDNQFFPSRIRLKHGLETRLLFTTVNRRPAALVIERLNVQRWVAKEKAPEFATELERAQYELNRELSSTKVTEVVLEPRLGTYSFHDALTGATGEIVVE